MSVMSSEDTCESTSASVMVPVMMYCDVTIVVSPADRTGARSSSSASRSVRAAPSPAWVPISSSTAVGRPSVNATTVLSSAPRAAAAASSTASTSPSAAIRPVAGSKPAVSAACAAIGSAGMPSGPGRKRLWTTDAGERTCARDPASVSMTRTSGVSPIAETASTSALKPSGSAIASPSTSTWVVSPKPPPNSSWMSSSVTANGASSGRKSVNENSVEMLLSPYQPKPPSTSITARVGIGMRSARNEVRPMSWGRRRLEVAPMPSVGRRPARSARRSSSTRRAGTNVSMRMNEATIPREARMPKSARAGMGLTMLARNPIAVVTVASTSATPTVPIARVAPSVTPDPEPTSSR